MIKLNYRDSRPIHEQITSGIKELIINGVLKPDEQLPSVRELSVSLTVNPNTVQRAYKNLETEGVIYSIRGKGNFISGKLNTNNKKIDELYELLKSTVKELAYYGEDESKINGVIKNIYSERS